MKTIDPGYPKNISDGWDAVYYPIGAVMTWKDGETYFNKAPNFAKHDWHLYKPEKISKIFEQCRENNSKMKMIQAATEEEDNGVVKTTVFAPLIAFLVILASLAHSSVILRSTKV